MSHIIHHHAGEQFPVMPKINAHRGRMETWNHHLLCNLYTVIRDSRSLFVESFPVHLGELQ